VTARELALLRFFLDNPERVVSRRELLREVWGYSEQMESRTPDTFMARLRKLVEPDPGRPRYLVSVRGQGYRYVPAGDER
jgi:two-component system OmpR family response regulator